MTILYSHVIGRISNNIISMYLLKPFCFYYSFNIACVIIIDKPQQWQTIVEVIAQLSSRQLTLHNTEYSKPNKRVLGIDYHTLVKESYL